MIPLFQNALFKVTPLYTEQNGLKKTAQCSGMVGSRGRRIPLCFDRVMVALGHISNNRGGIELRI